MLVLVGLAFAVLPVGSASADTAIGEVGGSDSSCSQEYVVADTHYVVPPSGGKITRFSFRAGPNYRGEEVGFLVLRPSRGGGYSVIAKTETVPVPGQNELVHLSTAIPVEGGDILGLWSPRGLDHCWRYAGSHGTGGYVLAYKYPRVGEEVSFSYSNPDLDLNESAELGPARIRHVWLIMLENHSFAENFGEPAKTFAPPVRGIDGVSGAEASVRGGAAYELFRGRAPQYRELHGPRERSAPELGFPC